MTLSAMFGTQVFVSPDLNREEFEREFLQKFDGGFKFYDLVPDAHDGQKLYELWVFTSQKDEVLPWFEEYCSRHGYSAVREPASGFGWGQSG
jgi:hypothetical protein